MLFMDFGHLMKIESFFFSSEIQPTRPSVELSGRPDVAAHFVANPDHSTPRRHLGRLHPAQFRAAQETVACRSKICRPNVCRSKTCRRNVCRSKVCRWNVRRSKVRRRKKWVRHDERTVRSIYSRSSWFWGAIEKHHWKGEFCFLHFFCFAILWCVTGKFLF